MQDAIDSTIQGDIAEVPEVDRESLLRELLHIRLDAWLGNKCFFTHELKQLHEIVEEIVGTEELREQFRVPTDIDRLNCIEFKCLSPANLRECLWLSLTYIGIDHTSGPRLLGDAGWEELTQRVEKLTSQPALNKNGASENEGASAWEQRVLSTSIEALFKGNHFFTGNIGSIADALNDLRRENGMMTHDYRSQPGYRVLSVLSCVEFSEMDPEVIGGLKAVIWEVLGLDPVIGKLAFGEEGWNHLEQIVVAPNNDNDKGKTRTPLGWMLIIATCIAVVAIVMMSKHM